MWPLLPSPRALAWEAASGSWQQWPPVFHHPRLPSHHGAPEPPSCDRRVCSLVSPLGARWGLSQGQSKHSVLKGEEGTLSMLIILTPITLTPQQKNKIKSRQMHGPQRIVFQGLVIYVLPHFSLDIWGIVPICFKLTNWKTSWYDPWFLVGRKYLHRKNFSAVLLSRVVPCQIL